MKILISSFYMKNKQIVMKLIIIYMKKLKIYAIKMGFYFTFN